MVYKCGEFICLVSVLSVDIPRNLVLCPAVSAGIELIPTGEFLERSFS
jgi:hypothetical protein